MKIVHNRKNCIGCNVCVECAPDFWEILEDGKAFLKDSVKNKNGIYIREINVFELNDNKKVADDCPVKVIKILN